MSEDKIREKGSIFSASPWDRERKEKMQKEQVLDARRARDLEISRLESVDEPNEKQQEWLRILRLEREFQRRADLEPDDDDEGGSSGGESSDDTATGDAEKVSNFSKDKVKENLNERMGIKLLDDLLVHTSKTSPDKERNLMMRTPSEKHFIPLDVAIPDNEISSHALPMTNNILKISSEQPPSFKDERSSKPPVPAPRPSKACTPVLQNETGSNSYATENGLSNSELENMGKNISSLAKLDISDSSAFFCSIENGDHSSRSTPQDNWLIEVPSNLKGGDAFIGEEYEQTFRQQNGIYEATMFDQMMEKKSGRNLEGRKTEKKMKQQNGVSGDVLMEQILRQQNGMHNLEDLREQKVKHQNGVREVAVIDHTLNSHRVEIPTGYKSKHYTDFSEQSRIYENIKPADYQYLRTQTISGSSYTSHTLPKTIATTNDSLTNKSPPRNGFRPHEKKFPVMGVSSTLTKKGNGYVPSDADILPSLYASCKAQQNVLSKVVPSDLVDKSPEFKKMWVTRPEKLTFQDKIRKFSIQAGEDDLPRDRVKNSRAQREIENKFVEAHKRPGYQKPIET